MTPTRVQHTPHPVYWIIAVALVAIAAILIARPGPTGWSPQALAQPTATGGARGVFAFTGQLAKDTHGVFVVDVDAMTMWAYEYIPAKGCLRLAAARSWQYDRYLENLNACDLPPEMVEKMVEEQRKYKLQEIEAKIP